MGFVLTIFYLVTNYLTPVTLFGPLAEYRIELILAVLILLVSLPKLMGSFILKTAQSLALIGLAIAASLSVLFGAHWAGGGVHAFLDFIPNAFAFFLVCLHCNSKRKLQIVVLMLLFVCLFVIARGCIDLRHLAPEGAEVQAGQSERTDPDLWNMEHPYLLAMKNDQGEMFYRIRGLGLINDPNDFGQLLVCVTPLLFFFWRAKKILFNVAFVVLPVCVLLFGGYLTHSRGALLALIAVAIVAARRRVGMVPAVLLAVALFAGAMALNFTGGRQISEQSGEDRTSLWGQGLEIVKAHPLFGVGFGNMPDYTEDHHTAHNSLVVCAAELGLFGLYFWSLFLLPTVRDALAIASPKKLTEGEPIVLEESPFPQPAWKVEELDKAEINRLGRLVILSLTGLLVAAWFLSRAYVMTFFLLGGVAEVVFQMALQRKMVASRLPLGRTLVYAGGLLISLLLATYILLRVVNLTRVG
jgi:O-antigen ligase